MSKTPAQTEIRSLAKQAHAVFLVNFVAPNHVKVCEEIAKRVGRLTVLASVEMEANRDWETDWGNLNVVVQKTKTFTRNAKHPGGYQEANYIHVPLDTFGQLRRLKPDAILSLELGARTAFSSAYRMFSRCAHIAGVYASERSEAGRGWVRKHLRRRLLRRADWVTFNGPSCRRYLLSLGADGQAMSAWDYAADPAKPYRGPIRPAFDPGQLKLATVGQLSERKGIIHAAKQLNQWAAKNPQVHVQWNVIGTGPLQSELCEVSKKANYLLRLHGHCEPSDIRIQYCDNDALFFPTLSDEWGLVVEESLHSALPVIGSVHSQAVETLVKDGDNGFPFDPEVDSSLCTALDQFSRLSKEDRIRLSQNARHSVAQRTPQVSAQQFVDAVGYAIAKRKGIKLPSEDCESEFDVDVEVPVA